ncbi:MAG: circumsporozoite protein-membrane associated protein, partial [Pirellulales bacterium]|nr:circumsporozoite protein-membrane associated protein [Pirellulales bacterium]
RQDPSSAEQSSTGTSAASGDGASGKPGFEDVDTPPDPADMEYAKKATDMVLDYLEQTRDAPDQDLLKELNWTEADLQRFADRWKKIRQMERAASDPTQNRDLEETLKSLGLRPPTRATGQTRDSADSLRNLRDSGNRRPVPAMHREAFEAFQRAIGARQP